MKSSDKPANTKYSISANFKNTPNIGGLQRNNENFQLKSEPDKNLDKISATQDNLQKKNNINKSTTKSHNFLLIFFIIYKLFGKIFKHLIQFDTVLATWFFIGKIPIAPGTLGSLAAYPIFYYVLYFGGSIEEKVLWLYYIIGILCVLALWSVSHYQKRLQMYDHSSIVIDEIIGQLLTLAIALPSLYQLTNINFDFGLNSGFNLEDEVFMFLVAFAAFRFFDITKPLGIWFIQINMRNAIGVILDDIIAGIYAGITIIGLTILIQLIWSY